MDKKEPDKITRKLKLVFIDIKQEPLANKYPLDVRIALVNEKTLQFDDSNDDFDTTRHLKKDRY